MNSPTHAYSAYSSLDLTAPLAEISHEDGTDIQWRPCALTNLPLISDF